MVAHQQAEVTMDRLPGSAALRGRGRAAAAFLLGGALMLGTLAQPAMAQSAPPPGSTANGTVPTSEGNVWNGLDHQPTPSEVAPINNPNQQAQINHTLRKLDKELLKDPLPKLPAGAPPVESN
jgi:hypothetical protein